MSEVNVRKRKANKGKWHQNFAKKRKFALCPELKGFLLFCNCKEKETIREAYVLLNQFADRMYGPEMGVQKLDKEDDNVSNTETGDADDNEIEDELEKEKALLMAKVNKDESERRFQVVESGIKNVLFVRTTVEDPVALVTEILKEILETHVQRGRHLLRLIPIQKTCKAYEGPVKEAVKNLLGQHYKIPENSAVVSQENQTEEVNDVKNGAVVESSSPPTYCVIFKSRLNQSFFKQDAIDVVGKIMKELNPNAQVEYKNPDLAIIFEIMKSHCCLSVLPNYYKYKKYNLIELASASTANQNDTKNGKDTSVKDEDAHS